MKFEDETPEEALQQCEHMEKQREALDRGDTEAVAKYRRLVKLAPSSLMAMKKTCGADYIRENGFNTEYADAEYGPGWLDRQEAGTARMNVAGPSSETLDLARTLISQEVRATLAFQNSSDETVGRLVGMARDARYSLLCPMKEAAKLRDIDLMLLIERHFLTEELGHLANNPIKVSSLNLGITQVDAALNLLRAVRDPSVYKHVALSFTFEENQFYGMPRDEAQQFFKAHIKRLRRLFNGRLDDSEIALIKRRIKNIKVARKVYTRLQSKALIPPEVYVAPALHLVS